MPLFKKKKDKDGEKKEKADAEMDTVNPEEVKVAPSAADFEYDDELQGDVSGEYRQDPPKAGYFVQGSGPAVIQPTQHPPSYGWQSGIDTQAMPMGQPTHGGYQPPPAQHEPVYQDPPVPHQSGTGNPLSCCFPEQTPPRSYPDDAQMTNRGFTRETRDYMCGRTHTYQRRAPGWDYVSWTSMREVGRAKNGDTVFAYDRHPRPPTDSSGDEKYRFAVLSAQFVCDAFVTGSYGVQARKWADQTTKVPQTQYATGASTPHL